MTSLSFLSHSESDWGSEARRFAGPLVNRTRVVADSRWKLGTAVRISSTPFGLLLDEHNVVVAKGMSAHSADLDWFIEQLEIGNRERLPAVELAHITLPRDRMEVRHDTD